VTLADETWASVLSEFKGRLDNFADELFQDLIQDVLEDESIDLGP
jgi:hypothetical protein